MIKLNRFVALTERAPSSLGLYFSDRWFLSPGNSCWVSLNLLSRHVTQCHNSFTNDTFVSTLSRSLDWFEWINSFSKSKIYCVCHQASRNSALGVGCNCVATCKKSWPVKLPSFLENRAHWRTHARTLPLGVGSYFFSRCLVADLRSLCLGEVRLGQLAGRIDLLETQCLKSLF